MTPEEIIKMISDRVKDTANVKVVFGDPVLSGGVTVIPVATVKVAGGGRGLAIPAEGEEPRKGAMGLGVQIAAKPLGYIEVKDGTAKLVPITDVTKIVVGGMVAGTLALFTVAKLASMFVFKRHRMRMHQAG